MVDLTPYLRDPLLAAIDNALEKKELDKPIRDYIGASTIGDDCSRKIWYKWRGHREIFDAETIRRFEDGHTTEAKVISWLRLVPSIEIHIENMGKQYGFSDYVGKFKGHYDGVIKGIPQASKTWHILEVKCVNEKKFKEIDKWRDKVGEKNILKEWNKIYYAQAVLYMYYENINRHLTIVATPGGRDLTCFRTEADNKFAEGLRGKAHRIINATEPPERIGGSDWWQCRMCNFKEMCHGQD